MLSLSLSVLLTSISWVSLATGQKVKIISPTPGSPVAPGTTLNLTLEVDGDVCHQVALGFGLNSKPADSKSLGSLLLGTLDTTKTPFDASTKQLSYPLQIPPADKFVNGASASYSLVVSQYYFSGATHTPDCNVVSVPVAVGAVPNAASPNDGPQGVASPGDEPQNDDLPAPASDSPTNQGANSQMPNPSGTSDDSATVVPKPSSSPANKSVTSPKGSALPCANGTDSATHQTASTGGDDIPVASNGIESILGNVTSPSSGDTLPLTANDTSTSPSSKCTGSSRNSTAGANSTSNGTSDWSPDMSAGCPAEGNSTNNSTGNIFTPPQTTGSNSTDNSAASPVGLSTQSVALSFAVVLGCMSTLA